jgi:cardiolipin synthase
VVPSASDYRFPLRDGNRFELLVDGGRFYERMLGAIESAQRYVLLQQYLFESGRCAERFIDALIRAAARGVAVNLVLDAWGARGLSGADRERIADSGAAVVFHNQLDHGKWLINLLRDHRKLLLVDGDVAYVGGAGIADAFDPAAARGPPWHDVMVEVGGPVLVDWQALFAEAWEKSAGSPVRLSAAAPEVRPDGQRGRVVSAGRLMRNDLSRSVYARIRRARERVWLATAYFVPSRKLRRALQRAAQRGVDVRLLLPGPRTDVPLARYAGRRFYARLLRHGLRVFEYQPSFVHAKMLLCDEWVSIGSSNLDRWNLRWNLEANQEVADARFAHQVRDLFEHDFSHCLEWSYQSWTRRPRLARLAEWLWGMVDIWLTRLRSPLSRSGVRRSRGRV